MSGPGLRVLRVHLLGDWAARIETLTPLLDPAIELTWGETVTGGAAVQILVSGRPAPVDLEACPNLEAVVIPWAGAPTATIDLLRDYPRVALHNLHHNAVIVAEMAVGLLLAAARRLAAADRQLRQGDWSIRYGDWDGLLLDGKTVLLLGYGAIGQRVAQVCAALGMRVIAVRRDPAKAASNGVAAAVYGPDALAELLPHAAAMVISLPLTPATEGLIGADELALLPRGAVLVNVGRGPIVDQAALFAALESGQLGAAGLDVWYRYPRDEASRTNTAPADFPFESLDNVVMSPHRAGHTRDTERYRMEHLAALLNAAAQGGPMPNRVQVDAGY